MPSPLADPRPVIIVDGNGNPVSSSGGSGSSFVPSSGPGATDATTQRVVLASDDPLVTSSSVQNVSGSVGANGASVSVQPGSRDSLVVQVTGTFTATLTPQVSQDGTNWVAIAGSPLLNLGSGAYAATITAAGVYQVGIGGFANFRLVATAYTSGTATITGTVTTGNIMVALDAPLPAGSAALGSVSISGTPTVTATPPVASTTFTNLAATTNATLVKATAGNLFSVTYTNYTSATVYLKVYNQTTAPTVGTSVPVLSIPVASNTMVTTQFGPLGLRFSSGISFATTTAIADTDATAPATAAGKVAVAYN